MSKPFPADEPYLNGYFAPLLAECDARDLPVSGEVPRELSGTLYRNGPNPRFAPRGPYHWFSGDGMLHAFQLENGRASYRNRWVRTPKWELESAEGEGLSGAFGNPRFSDPRIVALGSTSANTNVVWHAGRQPGRAQVGDEAEEEGVEPVRAPAGGRRGRGDDDPDQERGRDDEEPLAG